MICWDSLIQVRREDKIERNATATLTLAPNRFGVDKLY